MAKKFIYILLGIVVTCNCFGQNGDNIFDDTYIHTIEINSIEALSYVDFHSLLFDSHNEVYRDISADKPYFAASVTIDGTTLDTIGVRYKGMSTFENAAAIEKYPLKLDINEFVSGQKIDGLKKINLHNNLLDVSCMRAKLSMEIMNRMGIASPRVAYAKVYVNGSYRGLYSMVEQIDKTFVRSNYDSESTGFLHKAWGLTIGFPTPTFGGQDTSMAELQHRCPLKTKKSTKNYKPLQDFIIACNATTDNEFENDVSGVFDLESFMAQQAINMVISDKDHYCSANWNFYLYLHPSNNKWYMIPWDYDLAFSAQNAHIDDVANTFWFTRPHCFLNQRLFNIPNLKTRYHDALCEVLNDGMDSLWINNRIAEIGDLISTEVEEDPFFWDISDYNTFLDEAHTISGTGGLLDGIENRGIRDYINSRFQEVRQSLINQGYVCNETTTSVRNHELNQKVKLYPNPARDIIDLENLSNTILKNIIIENSIGQEVITIKNLNIPSGGSAQIDISNLLNGFYYLKFEGVGPRTNFVKKIIKW